MMPQTGSHIPSASAVRVVFWLTALSPFASASQPLTKQVQHSITQCDNIALKAKELVCNQGECELTEDVQISCGDARLEAEKVAITLTPDGAFVSAQAQGEVALFEDRAVLVCQTLKLSTGIVRAQADNAILSIKESPAALTRNSRSVAKLTGDLQQLASGEIIIIDGSFTLCDCQNAPPSWQLTASEVRLTPNERAAIYWPILWINPFGLGMMPITPPLPYLSLPLTQRAPGLLPPTVSFLGSPLPTVDFPVFVPIGDAWDLTVAPGLRMDWGNHSSNSASWGAPRLGIKIRYAPSASLKGTINVNWTMDHHHGAARRSAERVVGNHNLENLSTEDQNALLQQQPHWPLTHRVSLEVNQRVDFSPRLRWLLQSHWVSDDLLLQDFNLSVQDRIAAYLPSRTQLYFRHPVGTALIAADHYIHLNDPIGQYSNLSATEFSHPQRAPSVALTLGPLALTDHAYLESNISLNHYSPWQSDSVTDANTVGYLQATVHYAQTLGPLNSHAYAGISGLSIHPNTSSSTGLTLGPHLGLNLGATLMGSIGSTIHTIEPSLELKAMPWEYNPLRNPFPFDEYSFRRSVFAQSVLRIKQGLWLNKATGMQEALSLDIAQPIDIETGNLLPTRIELEWAEVLHIQGRAWSEIQWQTPEEPIKEVGARLSLSLHEMLRLNTFYARRSTNLTRYQQNIDHPSTDPDDTNAQWRHLLNIGVHLAPGPNIQLRYESTLLLPPPATTPTASPLRPTLTSHNMSIRYGSSCRCWGVQMNLSLPALPSSQEPSGLSINDLRFKVLLTLGDI